MTSCGHHKKLGRPPVIGANEQHRRQAFEREISVRLKYELIMMPKSLLAREEKKEKKHRKYTAQGTG